MHYFTKRLKLPKEMSREGMRRLTEFLQQHNRYRGCTYGRDWEFSVICRFQDFRDYTRFKHVLETSWENFEI